MNRKGFALAEAAVLAAVIACITALLLVFGHDQRRQGRLGADIGKLRSIGSLTTQYAADNADKFWTFSWKKGQNLSQWPDLNNASSDLYAAANQAVDILRRRAGRQDMPGMSGWVPHLTYSHLTLADYCARVPDETFISAADERRLTWSRDPRGFDFGYYPPAPPGVPGNTSTKRWPYSSSFMLPTAFFDKSAVSYRVYQGQFHYIYTVSASAILGARLRSDVVFPAHKVILHDSNARHFGAKQPYCTHDEARLPLAFVDGAVAVRPAADANPGWFPRSPASGSHQVFEYRPDLWEPPTLIGLPSENVIGRFRWTRGFLDGRDFGGPEACTGQPGCP